MARPSKSVALINKNLTHGECQARENQENKLKGKANKINQNNSSILAVNNS